MGDYSSYGSVSNMIGTLNLHTADPINASIILFYKIINKLISISSNELIALASVTRGHKH